MCVFRFPWFQILVLEHWLGLSCAHWCPSKYFSFWASKETGIKWKRERFKEHQCLVNQTRKIVRKLVKNPGSNIEHFLLLWSRSDIWKHLELFKQLFVITRENPLLFPKSGSKQELLNEHKIFSPNKLSSTMDQLVTMNSGGWDSFRRLYLRQETITSSLSELCGGRVWTTGGCREIIWRASSWVSEGFETRVNQNWRVRGNKLWCWN